MGRRNSAALHEGSLQGTRWSMKWCWVLLRHEHPPARQHPPRGPRRECWRDTIGKCPYWATRPVSPKGRGWRVHKTVAWKGQVLSIIPNSNTSFQDTPELTPGGVTCILRTGRLSSNLPRLVDICLGLLRDAESGHLGRQGSLELWVCGDGNEITVGAGRWLPANADGKTFLEETHELREKRGRALRSTTRRLSCVVLKKKTFTGLEIVSTTSPQTPSVNAEHQRMKSERLKTEEM